MATVVRDSKIPFYQQLYEILRRRILGGEWQAGELLQSETELMEQYGVSRITARKALEKLVNEGLIYRERGRGTFVAHPTMEQALSRIISFTEDMRQRGHEPGTKVLFSGLIPAPQEIAEKLQVEPGEELARLDRLRLADGEPMSVEESHLVHRYCEGVLRHDFALSPLRETLERDYGIRLVHARQVIRATSVPRKLADTLSIRPNVPVLYIERVTFSEQGTPVEFLRFYHRGDRYSLYNELAY